MSASRAATRPAVHDSATASCRPRSRRRASTCSAQRPLVLRVDGLAQLLAQAGDERVERRRLLGLGAHGDLDLERGGRRSSCACRPASPPAAAKARATAGSPDGVDAQGVPQERRRRARAGAAMRRELERRAPDRRELARRARAARAAWPAPNASSSPGAVPAGGMTVAPRGHERLLAVAVAVERGIGAAPARVAGRDRGDRREQLLVERRARRRRPRPPPRPCGRRASARARRSVITRSWPASSRSPRDDLVVAVADDG